MNKFQAIQSTLEEFDFERVHDVMTYLNWTWLRKKDGEFVDAIPTISDLKATAMQLLSDSFDNSVANKKDCGCSTGGFSVQSFYDGTGTVKLILSFNLCEWEELADSVYLSYD